MTQHNGNFTDPDALEVSPIHNQATEVTQKTDGQSSEEETPYEQEHSITFLIRLWDTPKPSGRPEHPLAAVVRQHIDWSATSRDNRVTIEHKGRTYYVRYSTPVWYSYSDTNPKLVDFIVVGEDPHKVNDEWETEILSADTQREALRDLVREEILPELASLESVVVVLGRGTVFDPRRVMEQNPDVDIILFLNIPLETEEEKQQIQDQLHAIQARHPHIGVGVTMYSLNPGTNATYSDSDVETDENTKAVIRFDLMSLTGRSSYVSSLRSGHYGNKLKPYSRDCLQFGEVLMDRSGGLFDQIRSSAIEQGTI